MDDLGFASIERMDDAKDGFLDILVSECLVPVEFWELVDVE